MANNSDYKKPTVDLFDLLPSVYQSDVNRSLLANLHNRFFTKTELSKVIGRIGVTNPKDTNTQQLREESILRQAWQLQPIMYNKIATVDHATTYRDMLQRMIQLGIDPDRQPEWGDTNQFNFMPPIDPDKLINFTDYYWYDPIDPNSVPQYITIQNKCTKASAILASAIEDAGGSLTHVISGLNTSRGEITIAGVNLENVFTIGSSFDIELSTTNNGSYTVASSVYTGTDTVIKVNESLSTTTELGRVTIEARFTELLAIRNCICYNQVGFGVSLFDDNDGLSWEQLPPNDWASNITQEPTGTNAWDLSTDCESQTDAWSLDNRWVHYTDVPDIAVAKRATMPIIEYRSEVELNEWSSTEYQWKYRATLTDPWTLVDNKPTYNEMLDGFSIVSVNPTLKMIEVDGTRQNDFDVNQSILVRGPTGTILQQLTVVWIDPTVGPTTTIQVSEPVNTITTTDLVLPFITTSVGDPWISFKDQWLFVGVKSTVPVENQTKTTNVKSEEFIIPSTATTLDRTVLNLTTYANTALAGSNDVRVYVNGIRQYVTYVEITQIVGVAEYVVGINFLSPLADFDIVTVELGYSADVDSALEQILVATDAGDKMVSLVQYRLVEQTKKKNELKYPLFNIYDVDGTYRGVSEIFKFTEDASAPLEMRVGGKRIVVSDYGRNYHFDNKLVTSDGELLCYKDTTAIDSLNPDGLSTIWRSDGAQYAPEKITEHRIKITDLAIELTSSDTFTLSPSAGDMTGLFLPNTKFEVSNSTFDDGVYTVTSSLYDGTYTRISVAEGITSLSVADGTLRSLVPSDWGIPDQWYYNPSHDVKTEVKYSELLTHFNTIIASQSPANIVPYTKLSWRLLLEYNYGVGGTIKEHNYSYDLFLSSMFVESGSPIDVIEFAQNRYENNLNFISEAYKREILSELTTIDNTHMVDMPAAVLSTLISIFEQNDINSTTFGDSNTYDATTDTGIRGWVATLPFIRQSIAVDPLLLSDAALNINEIQHHDGHISTFNDYNSMRQDTASTLSKTNYSSSPVEGTWCEISINPPEVVYALYKNNYTGRAGKYWYDATNNKLYRFNVQYVGTSQPTITSLDGTLWYDTNTDLLMVLQSNAWVPVTNVVNDISQAWAEIDFDSIYSEVLRRLESKLTQAAPSIQQPTFDYSTLTNTPEKQQLYSALEEQLFLIQMQRSEILEPYSSVGYYVDSNAFTWNYKGVDTSTIIGWPTTQSSIDQPWGATWWDIYQKIYNTPYPHLEPWKLQGYTSKPDWWDGLYADTSGTRRWVYNHATTTGMWENIRLGIIPTGVEAPDGSIGTGLASQVNGYDYFCVNVDDVQIGQYKPDDLLPPYINLALLPAFVGVNRTFITNQSSIPDNPTSFPNTILTYSDYVFGDNGPNEWAWRKSSQFLYDTLKIAFQMQPVRFMHYTWGNDYYNIAQLNVDKVTKRVPSHKTSLFHGDVLADGTTYVVPGINQWYTNYNRYNALDNKTADFREMWRGWKSLLTYQFGSMIDAQGFVIEAPAFSLTDQDHTIVLKKSAGINKYNVDSLQISTVKFSPKKVVGVDDASDWKFVVDVATNTGRDVTYYDVDRRAVFEFVEDMDGNTPTGLLPNSTTYSLELDVGGSPITVNVIGITGQTIQAVINKINSDLNTAGITATAAVEGNRVIVTNTDTGLGSNISVVSDGLFSAMTDYVELRSINKTTYYALGGDNTSQAWYHKYLNKDVTLTTTFPMQITGMQNLLDFVDGYVEYLNDIGFIFNDNDVSEVDPETGRLVNWQTEQERFIDAMFQIRQVFFDPAGQHTVPTSPTFEMNPFRNHLWFNNKSGVVSNLHVGPFETLSNVQTIYDQYGRTLSNDQVNVYREDSKCHIAIRPELQNDVDPVRTDYDYIHLGGVQLYTDDYEHVVVLEPYTVDGQLLYDPFLGLDVGLFAVEYDRLDVNKHRPNAGGYFLHNNQLVNNFEHSIEMLQHMYDTNTLGSNTDVSIQARQVVGYDSPEYFDLLGIDDRSKFKFWKGMIQHKGSTAAVNALINSIQFEEAVVDEFWAYQIAQYGASASQNYPEVKLFSQDVSRDTLKLQFNNSNVEVGFIQINSNDDKRWFDRPLQTKLFDANTNNITFTSTAPTVLDGIVPAYGTIFDVGVLCDTIEVVFFQGTAVSESTPPAGTQTISTFGYVVGTDNIEVFRNDEIVDPQTYTETSSTSITISVTAGDTIRVVRKPGRISNAIKINATHYDIEEYSNISLTSPESYFRIYPLIPAYTKLGPGKLIDYQSDAVVYDIPVYDPARGYYSTQVAANVDYQAPTDIAQYSYSLDGNVNVDQDFWAVDKVDRIWLDNNTIGYVPYYDDKLIPSTDDRIANWGRLSDWAEINVYQWTKSPVPPAEYAGYVKQQASDPTVVSNDKATGAARQVLYKRTRKSRVYNMTAALYANTQVTFDVTWTGPIASSTSTQLSSQSYTMVVEEVDDLGNISSYAIVIDGTRNQTFGELVAAINLDLIESNVTAIINQTGFTLTANSDAVASINVIDGNLLQSITTLVSNTFDIAVDVNITSLNTIDVLGTDLTASVVPGSVIEISSSPSNDGSYVVQSISFSASNTTITLAQPLVDTTPVGTLVTSDYVGLYVSTTISARIDSEIVDTAPNTCLPPTESLTLSDGLPVYVAGDLPNEIQSRTVYTVREHNWPNVGAYKLEDSKGKLIRLPSNSVITLIDRDFPASFMAVEPRYTQRTSGVGVDVSNPGLFTVVDVNNGFNVCDLVNVYRNGKFHEQGQLSTTGTYQVAGNVMVGDVYTFEYKETPSDAGLSFDPTDDDGQTLTQYVYDYPHVRVNETYYFWVEGKTTQRGEKTTSIAEIAQQMTYFTQPYMFYMDVDNMLYDQVIVRGLGNSVRENNRYKLRLIQDFTLRDDYGDTMELKNKHTEWTLFRELQDSSVPKVLWDKMTEAMVGFKLNEFAIGTLIPIPAPEFALYDDVYQTDTRFGLKDGQAFVDSKLALNTIEQLFNQTDFDTYPVDKEWFLANYNTNTPENTLTFFNYVYDRFSSRQINKIFFEIMHDALISKRQYAGLFKTSLIALENVRVLETQETA